MRTQQSVVQDANGKDPISSCAKARNAWPTRENEPFVGSCHRNLVVTQAFKINFQSIYLLPELGWPMLTFQKTFFKVLVDKDSFSFFCMRIFLPLSYKNKNPKHTMSHRVNLIILARVNIAVNKFPCFFLLGKNIVNIKLVVVYNSV